MSALDKRLEKLEAANNPGFHLLFLDPQEGETEDEAKARIGAGLPANSNIVWVSWTDAHL